MDPAFDDPLVSIQFEDQEANPGFQGKELIACNSRSVLTWDLNKGALKSLIKCSEMNPDFVRDYLQECKAVKRDPHNPHVLAIAYGNRFELIDTRAGSTSTI